MIQSIHISSLLDREIDCGDVSNVATAGATLNPESECSTACPGNISYTCGAGNRISYYKWSGTPLSDWKFVIGNDAGKYQLLIGGPIVPLVITEGVNGKVTFVEKYGTSKTPGSTVSEFLIKLHSLRSY